MFIRKLDLKSEEVEVQNEAEKQPTEVEGADFSTLPSEDIVDALDANEDGDAALFTKLHRNRFVFDHDLNRWFRWEGNYWKEDCLKDAMAGITSVIEQYKAEDLRQLKILFKEIKARDEEVVNAHFITKELLKRIKALHTLHRKKSVLTLSTIGTDSLGIRSDRWDLNPWLLGCLNGVIDLRTGEFRPGKPEDYIKTVAPTEFQGIDTPAPNWQNFLLQIFDGNEALVSFMQRLLGYAITGNTTEHVLPMLWGKGRNGKGTLIEVLGKILGNPIAGPVQSGMLLSHGSTRSSASPSPDIMTLRGKRIVWGSETNEGRRFDVGKVKWLVGGDTLIGRPPHGSREIQFNPTHTLLLLTNHKPKAEADDYAFWQRVLLIPFNLSFVDNPEETNERKRDPYLKEKLLAESSGILAWLVKGCLLWQREGLNAPTQVKEATASYKEEEDILGHYIKERCKIVSDGVIRANEFYSDYKRWCIDNGHRPLSNTKFGKKMSERYPKDKDGKGNFYSGVSLV